ncbi:MAG: hypothetical protein E7579_02645 [Ruminococcaceae bacterium]|nr:hypothetical protein [Oscillospiraceae bacterium]
MKKRLFACLLLALLLAPSIVSCGGGEEPAAADSANAANPSETPAEETPAETEPPSDEEILGFASEDNGGATFTILTNSTKTYEFNVEEMTGDVVTDAVFEKDRKVEEYLGIDLDIVLEDGNWPAKDTFNAKITQAVTAGDAAYDLVNNTIVCVMPISSTGCFIDGKSLEYTNFDNPWWVADMYSRFSVAGKLYGFLGDASLSLYKDMTVTFFNKNIWEEQKPDVDLYELVRSNQWTLDTFIAQCSDMAIDLNGDGTFTEDDRLTFIGEYVPNGTWQTSLDLKVVELAEDGTPVFLGLTEKFATAYEKMRSFHQSPGALSYSSIDDQSFKSMNYFAQGNAATMCNFLYSTEYLRDMEADYGILPMPKYDETQEKYISQLGTSTSALFVPLTTKNLDLTSKVMETLAYYSYSYVSPKYYEVALKTKYASDEDMHEMLDIIRQGATFDFVFAYGTSLTNTPNSHFRFYNAGGEDIASAFAALKKPFEKSIEVMFRKYQELEH